MKLISVDNLTKKYADNIILQEISCDIYSGEIIGLIGLNGQGKSTFVKLLLDLVKKDSGNITRYFSLKKDIGVMLQEVSLPEHLKVKEWIELIRKFSDHPRTAKDVLDLMSLSEVSNHDCGKLSGGQKRKLQFSVAMTNNPKFLILDEPTVGMDVISKELFWTNIKKILKENNLTVLLISHDLSEIEAVASRVIILNKKQIVVDKQMSALQQEFEQSKIYVLDKQDLNETNIAFLKNRIEAREEEDKFYIKMSPQGKTVLNTLMKQNFNFEKIVTQTVNLDQYFRGVVGNGN